VIARKKGSAWRIRTDSGEWTKVRENGVEGGSRVGVTKTQSLRTETKVSLCKKKSKTGCGVGWWGGVGLGGWWGRPPGRCGGGGGGGGCPLLVGGVVKVGGGGGGLGPGQLSGANMLRGVNRGTQRKKR